MKRRTPAPPRVDRAGPWTVSITPVEGMLPFGRWAVRLHRGMISYGPGGGSWYTLTLSGARRKGARELARREALDARLAARRRLEEGTR